MPTSGLAEQIRALEEDLLDPAVRSDPERLEGLLADEFVEFGSSGRVWDKAAVVAELPDLSDASFSLSGFEARPLSETLVLARYRISIRDGDSVRHSLRSSLWTRRSARWQLLFHQGTPTNPPDSGR